MHLFSLPIFAGIAALVGGAIDSARKRGGRKLSHAVVMAVALLSMEGTTEWTTFERQQTVQVTKIVNASVDNVVHQIEQTPSFDKPRPFFISLFPTPISASGSGLEPGDEISLHYKVFKHIIFTPREGDIVFKVAKRGKDFVSFDIIKDTSYLSHYLNWESSTVHFEPIDATHTRVTWELSYKRMLDPIWYFGPLQHYAVTQAAETLIDNLATPL